MYEKLIEALKEYDVNSQAIADAIVENGTSTERAALAIAESIDNLADAIRQTGQN